MNTLDTRTQGGAAAQVGGLSGIDIHAATGRRVALGGDRSASGQLRFFSMLTLDLSHGQRAAGLASISAAWRREKAAAGARAANP